MSSERIQVGDVVQLKSGGPKMTVVAIVPESTYSIVCNWFEGGKVLSETFPPNALKKLAEGDNS